MINSKFLISLDNAILISYLNSNKVKKNHIKMLDKQSISEIQLSRNKEKGFIIVKGYEIQKLFIVLILDKTYNH